MANLQSKLTCFTCGDSVIKSETAVVERYGMGKVFECYPCFKSSKGTTLRSISESRQKNKQEYFCAKCKYKFSSRRAECPYCGKSDNLSLTQVSTNDLL